MSPPSDHLAIIGFAGRFPQAPSVDALWEMLRAGGDGITVFTDEELEHVGVPPELIRDPNYVKARACLDGIEYFDADFFGLVPAEAARLDPQQRLFLECAWEALEHAGHGARSRRPRVGVYASASASKYLLHLVERLGPAAREPFALDGTLVDFLALRAAYKLDLRGPAATVLTACSSSLVALHLACQGLVLGEADMALVGAASVAVPGREGRLWQEGSISSRDGRCRPFDANATGTVGGDAAVVIVLKRLEDAVADRDFIHAVVRGTSINNDGATKAGFTAPSMSAQARVVRDALDVAGVEPGDIGYIEAHGSGTTLGDPIEVAALAQAFEGLPAGSLPLGSIKANIGHTDAAAGLSGLVKAALCLRERTWVTTPGFERPNPLIDFPSTPFRVQTATEPWPEGAGPRRAGVSSFGMGGTNAHVVLEEPPPRAAPAKDTRPWHLLVLSARTRPALERMTTGLAEHLQAHPDLPLADVAHTLRLGREAFTHRRFVVARTAQDAARALATRDSARVFTGTATPGRPVAFLYPGLGDTRFQGAADLYAHAPVFRAALDTCAEKLLPLIGADVRTLLTAPSSGDRISRWGARVQAEGPPTRLAQPAVFAVSWALHALWTSLGVVPDTLAGYSLGEYVAATAAGHFTLDDALRVVAERARLVEELPSGAMTAVGLGADEVLALGMPGISIAAITGRAMCVAAGTPADVETLEKRLDAEGFACRRLDSRHAFHTPAMRPAAERFAPFVEQVRRGAPRLPFFSNVTGALHDATLAASAGYWVDHLTRPVRFAPVLEALAADPARVLVQVGPGAQLVRLAQGAGAGARERVTATSLPEEGSDGLAHWLGAVGRLWLSGVDMEWSRLEDTALRSRLPLPTYPFERKRHWVDGPVLTPARPVAPPSPAVSGERALPLESPLPAPSSSRALARDERERALLDIWRASFGSEDLGVHDDFFQMGGHSLLALQLLHRLRRAHGVDLSVRELMENPTVAKLAAYWGANASAPAPTPVAASGPGLPEQLRQAPPEEQRRLAESYVTDAAARALGRGADEVRGAADLSALGLGSSLADLVRVLKRDLGLVVYPHELMARPTVAGLGTLLREALGLIAPEPAPASAPEAPRPLAPRPAAPLSRRNPPAAFIFSSARSGSTLLRVMLAGHPKLFCPPELHLLMFDSLRQRDAQLSTSHFGKGLPRALMELCAMDASRADAMVADWLERDLSIPDVYRELQRLARPRLFVDKSPSYAEDPATLRRVDEWFSSSYAVVLVRHPYSVMESYVRNRIGSMGRASGEGPWDQAERHWLDVNSHLMDFLDEAPRPSHLLRYEDLMATPEPVLRGLCASLGVGYHPAVLTPYEGRRMIDGVGDPNLHEHDRVERELGDRWRQVRPPRPLRDATRRLAERLGYEIPGEST
ncbi:type I polyketide synthase [Pyxidicoccus trucidator]|uniref:type I polyketide synthase n=1 Tax=Pyxidicoccus trucidator TaxID=2709662 RepID=UPI0013D93B60|nr:type I polyketide synthase [Pyxidicoccus trucidator]